VPGRPKTDALVRRKTMAKPGIEIFVTEVFLTDPRPITEVSWGGDVTGEAIRKAPVRTEPHPPMVCVKLPKNVLGLFHSF
jgi:hypothetical protein